MLARAINQGFIAILPFQLFTAKPMPYPKHPTALRGHLLKKRCELELFQKDVGQRIGVSPRTIMNWEKGRTVPDIQYYPAIFSFLGYYPFPEPKALGERIVAWRRRHGVTRKALAKQLGIDEAALAKREMDIASTTDEKAVTLTKFLHRQFGNASAFCARAATR